MSDSKFAEYVTSGAFNLSLSKAMVNALAHVVHGKVGITESAICFLPEVRSMGSYSSLSRRGLVEWRYEKIIPSNLFQGERMKDGYVWTKTGPFVTEPGILVYKLLFAAGLVDLPFKKDVNKKKRAETISINEALDMGICDE